MVALGLGWLIVALILVGNEALPRARLQQCRSALWDQQGSAKYISPALEERLKNGLLTSGDLDRMFGLSVRQTERIMKEERRAFAIGVSVSLENALVDMSVPVGYAFAALCPEIGESTPSPLRVKETLGLTFKEALIALGWAKLPDNVFPKAEARYYEILDEFISNGLFPVFPRDGAAKLLLQLLAESDASVTIFTSLPRKTAISVLSMTGLSNLLEGRAGASRLIHPDPQQWADRLEGAQFLRACAEMRRAPMVSAAIDANPKKLLQAKRVGMCTVGLKESCSTPVLLRHSDRLFDTVSDITVSELYKMLRKNVEMSNGMQLQAQAADVRVPTNTVKLVAPAMEDNRRRASDTFADEYKSDIL